MLQTTILREAIKQQRVVPIKVGGYGLEHINNNDTVLVDTEFTDPTGGGVFILRNGSVYRCEHWGLKGIWTKNGNGGEEVMEVAYFKEMVIGLVIGHIQDRLISDRPIKL
jgi:hypothetical protein